MVSHKELKIPVHSEWLNGILHIPDHAKGLILFSHGSGSSRLSPRNNYVASLLQRANFGTFLFDLLTDKEDQTYENRFNIELLTDRLIEVTEWIRMQYDTTDLSLGYFGASTGAASALIAASEFGTVIKAVVSRGGRPDLAMSFLGQVISPTLLIVGGDDRGVIELNRLALSKLTSIKKLEIVRGATHLFEEPGKLEKVAVLAKEWFNKYLHCDIVMSSE